MDWNIVLEYALKILGSTLATLIITYGTILFTKLKTKIGEVRINNYLEVLVQAAEQIFPNLGKKTGPEKFAYVKDCIITKFPKLKNDPNLNALIEGAVYTISQKLKIEEPSTNTNTVIKIS